MDYKSQVSLREKQYICTINPGEFNVSVNPTAVTGSQYTYSVIHSDTFDFRNLDIIFRYINSKITTNSSEFWNTSLVDGDEEESIFNYYSGQITNYSSSLLTSELKCQLGELDFDIDNDGKVDINDGFMLWKYFIEKLTPQNYQTYTSHISKRKKFNDIIHFLNTNTGKYNTKYIKDEFLNFENNTLSDITGSYMAPYITTVGLYSGADLVGVAKLAHPIKNTGEIPINISVKWDY